MCIKFGFSVEGGTIFGDGFLTIELGLFGGYCDVVDVEVVFPVFLLFPRHKTSLEASVGTEGLCGFVKHVSIYSRSDKECVILNGHVATILGIEILLRLICL